MFRNSKFIIGATLTAILGMTACGNGGNDDSVKGSHESGEVTIDFGIHVANAADQEPAFYAVVEAFEEKYDDINVNLIGKEQSEHIKSIKMQSQSGDLPDIFWILQASADELNEAEMLMDLSSFLQEHEEIAASLRANMVDAFNDDGVQYGLPYQPLVTGMFYNEALLEEYGLELPETFEDLVEASEVLSENGI